MFKQSPQLTETHPFAVVLAELGVDVLEDESVDIDIEALRVVDPVVIDELLKLEAAVVEALELANPVKEKAFRALGPPQLCDGAPEQAIVHELAPKALMDGVAIAFAAQHSVPYSSPAKVYESDRAEERQTCWFMVATSPILWINARGAILSCKQPK
jgi:hypothetical protein